MGHFIPLNRVDSEQLGGKQRRLQAGVLSRTCLRYPDMWMISLVAGCFMFKCQKPVMDSRQADGRSEW